MAVVTLTINIPDGQMPRVLAAARDTWGQVPDGSGGMRDMTNGEITERFRQEVITLIKTIVRNSERRAAKIPCAGGSA